MFLWNIDICKYFSFLVYQRSAQLLHETLDTLAALTAFAVTHSLSFVDQKTDKSKDKTPKQHRYLGGKNNLGCSSNTRLKFNSK